MIVQRFIVKVGDTFFEHVVPFDYDRCQELSKKEHYYYIGSNGVKASDCQESFTELPTTPYGKTGRPKLVIREVGIHDLKKTFFYAHKSTSSRFGVWMPKEKQTPPPKQSVRPAGAISNKGLRWFWNQNVVGDRIMLGPNDPIPDGYILGKGPSLTSRRSNGNAKNNLCRKWIYNLESGERRMIKPDQPVPPGWILGRGPLHSSQKSNDTNRFS